jgi:serine/threonine protein kinase
MWSIGFILYVLLSGSYPFSDDDRDRKIATASFSLTNGKVWKSVSPEAKNLIKQLLVVNPDMRLTAKQALQHIWFTGTAPGMVGVFTSSSSSSSIKPSSSEQVSEAHLPSPPPPAAAAKGGRKAKGGTAKTKAAANAKPSNSPTNAVVAPSTGRSTRSSSRKGTGKIDDREAMPPPKGRLSPAKQKRTGAMDKWLSPGPAEILDDVNRKEVDSTTVILSDELVVGQKKRTRSSKAQQDNVVKVKRAKPPSPHEEEEKEKEEEEEGLGAASTCGANQPNPLDERFAMNSSLM